VAHLSTRIEKVLPVMDEKSPTSAMFTARKRPRQQRSKKMVEAILEAAAHILEGETHPFTTNHIAERAGVSIGSLYQYFPGAEAIMAALIEQHVVEERAAAEAIVATASERGDHLMHDLLVAFVAAHADAPRLTARLHALAPSFDLQDHLDEARDTQAASIAAAMGLAIADVQMSAMAVEGVVLATLATQPQRLKSPDFIRKLHAIALAPLGPLQ
jgi:AcrR family transcriptional regulator